MFVYDHTTQMVFVVTSVRVQLGELTIACQWEMLLVSNAGSHWIEFRLHLLH